MAMLIRAMALVIKRRLFGPATHWGQALSRSKATRAMNHRDRYEACLEEKAWNESAGPGPDGCRTPWGRARGWPSDRKNSEVNHGSEREVDDQGRQHGGQGVCLHAHGWLHHRPCGRLRTSTAD